MLSPFRKIVCLCAFVVCSMQIPAVAQSETDAGRADKVVCLLPIHFTNITAGDASMISDALRLKIGAEPGISVVDKEKSSAALLTVPHGPDSSCALSLDCMLSAGEKSQSQYAISGTIGKIGTLYTVSIIMANVKLQKRIFVREYEYTGTIEEFYSDVPKRIAADIFQQLSGAKTPRVITEEAPLSTARNGIERNPPEDIVSDSINGIIRAPALGLSGRVAVGSISRTQSKWGLAAYYVHPTALNSQLRVKFGIPLSGSDTTFSDYTRVVGDYYASLEHEWGFPRFGVGLGLATTRMQHVVKNAQLSGTYYDANNMIVYDPIIPYDFKETYLFNWVLTLRGGRPSAGFKGRISWPIPLNQSGKLPDNYFFEYSALGVFGNASVKGGIGLQGMIKSRTSSDSKVYNYYAYSYSTTSSNLTVEDSYIMAPCGKLAFVAGKHSVVCVSLDLGGIFIPRPDNSSWAPNIQLDYVFSLKPFTSPDVLDGTF